MVIAGFDVATKTGICVHDGRKFLPPIVWNPSCSRPAHLKKSQIDEQYEAEIAEEFRAFLFAFLPSHGIEYVAYEKPRTVDFGSPPPRGRFQPKFLSDDGEGDAGGGRRSNNLALVRAVNLTAALYGVAKVRKNIPCVAVPADTWRKSMLGYSRAPKKITGADARRAFIKKAVRDRCKLLGIKTTNDDMSDAAGVCWWLTGHLSPLGKLTADMFAEAS